MLALIDKLDKTILSGYQWVVDTSGRPFRWLAAQCTYGLGLATALYMWFSGNFSIVAVILALLAITVMLVITRLPFVLKDTCQLGRYIALSIGCVNLLRFFHSETATHLLVLLSLSDFFVMSFWNFMSCDPPRPRRRTSSKLAPSGAA